MLIIDFKKIKKKDLVNTISTIIASIFVAITNWAQLYLLTKTLDLFILGVYTLALAYSNPIYQFTGLQLRPLYVSDRSNKYSFDEYFSLRLFSIILSFFFGLIISYIIYNNDESFYEPFFVSIGIFILYGVDGIIDIFNARLHYRQELTKVSCSIGIRSFLALLGLFTGIYFFNSISIGIYLAILYKILGFYVHDFKFFLKDDLKIKITRKVFPLIKKSLPLGVSLLISSLNVNISKYFVNYSFGTDVQGVFSTISYLIVIGTIFVATLGQVLLPKMAIFHAKKKLTSFYKMHCVFLFSVSLIGGSIFIFSIFFGEFLLKILFSEVVSSYNALFPWIMGSGVFLYLSSANGYALTAASIIKEQVGLGIFSLTLNAGLNFLFLNKVTIQLIILFTGYAFILQFALGIILLIRRVKVHAK